MWSSWIGQGHLFFLVFICSLCLVTGILAGEFIPHPDAEMKLEEAEEQHVRPQPNAVTIDFFTARLNSAKTFHDVIRIFYGDFMSNEDVETLMMTSPNRYHSDHLHWRPRLGGHSTVNRPMFASIEGTSQPCPDSVYIPIETVAEHTERTKSLRHHRRRRRREKERRRTKAGIRKRARELTEKSQKKTKRETRQALAHLNEVSSELGACRVPVRKVIEVPLTATDLEYFPTCTVVYRCSNESGCCGRGSECVPKTKTNITRHFYVVRSLPSQHTIPDEPFVHTMTFENHTDCYCKKKPSLPRCLQCPHSVFRMVRDENATCVCDCDIRTDKTCSKIKKGRKKIADSKIRCMESGKCHKINCMFGEFDMSTGYCPPKRSAKRERRPKVNARRRQNDRNESGTQSESVSEAEIELEHAPRTETVNVDLEEMERRKGNLSGKR